MVNNSNSLDSAGAEQVNKANASGRQPVIFIHGLWLLPSSWARWAEKFNKTGYISLAPSWPGDQGSVEAAREDPNSVADVSLREAADRFAAVAAALDRKPVVIGHSFGGLLAQVVADRGFAAATVAISPAPFRGVLPLPLSALKASSPVLLNPANRHRAVALTYDEFRYAFANAVSEDEAHELYERYAVPAPGEPLFEGAFANLNPWTDDHIDVHNPNRGPLLLVQGSADHTVPTAMVEAAYRLQTKNPALTELETVEGAGHALTIDRGWERVAELALGFARRFAAPEPAEARLGEAPQESFPASDSLAI